MAKLLKGCLGIPAKKLAPRVGLEPASWGFESPFCLFSMAVDLVIFPVICSFMDVKGRKSR